mmetsp:Transcript_5846/g.36241  ORF Transcript_5846/g.36241 Transcript_5846/m.36241 type:complete len:298 (-) Transcript_5846:1579-2472(-)
MAITLVSSSKPRTLRLAKTHTRASRKVCTRAKVERNEVRRHEVARLASRTVAVGLAAWTCTGVAQAATGATSTSATGWVQSMIGFLLHLDVHLSSMIARYGAATYAILFAIVFCETGLVVTPFLPGDSLLFAAGAFAAMGSLNLGLLIGTLFVAAVLGDTVNYALGAWLGKKALDSNFIKNEYIEKTEGFYNKYGGKTVVLARFVPIVRTFAPFVAGIGSMYYSKFFFYNVVGGAIWTILFTLAGFFFGNLPFVQHNFTLVVLAIIAVSVVPVLVEVYQASKETKAAGGKLSKEDQI